MTLSKIESDVGNTLALAGAADLRDAAGLRTALLECLERGRPMVIDTKAIEAVDLTLLQLVYSARRTFQSAGLTVSLTDGGAFRNCAKEAGLPSIEEERP